MSDSDKILKFLGKNGPSASKPMLTALAIDLTAGRLLLGELAKKGAVVPPGARGKTLYTLPGVKIVNGNGTPVAAKTNGAAKANGKPAPKATPAKAAAPKTATAAAADPTPWAGGDPLASLKAELTAYEALKAQVDAGADRASKVKAAIEALA